jgi:hypothetical protein
MVETAKDVDTKNSYISRTNTNNYGNTSNTVIILLWRYKWNNRGNISKRWSRNKLFVHLKLFVSYSCSFFRTSSRSYFSGLGVGVYSITVTDGWGLWYRIDSVTIIEPSLVVASLRLSRTATCATQAQVTLTASGGTAHIVTVMVLNAYVPLHWKFNNYNRKSRNLQLL